MVLGCVHHYSGYRGDEPSSRELVAKVNLARISACIIWLTMLRYWAGAATERVDEKGPKYYIGVYALVSDSTQRMTYHHTNDWLDFIDHLHW